MTPLDIVLYKTASTSDGFLEAHLKSRGVTDVDLNRIPTIGETMLGQVPELAGHAGSLAGWIPTLGAQSVRLAGNLTGNRAKNMEAPGLTFAKWFNKVVGDPTKAGWKDTLYRWTSGGDGQNLGTYGLGPAAATLFNQFIKPRE